MTVREAWDAIARAETEALGDHLTFASVEPILSKLVAASPSDATGTPPAWQCHQCGRDGVGEPFKGTITEHGVTRHPFFCSYQCRTKWAAIGTPDQGRQQLIAEAEGLLSIQADGLALWTEEEQIKAGDVIERLLSALAASSRGSSRPPTDEQLIEQRSIGYGEGQRDAHAFLAATGTPDQGRQQEAKEHPIWKLCGRIDQAFTDIRRHSFDSGLVVEIADSATWLTAEIRGHLAASSSRGSRPPDPDAHTVQLLIDSCNRRGDWDTGRDADMAAALGKALAALASAPMGWQQVIEILKGIDKTESDSPDGWWETSVGADFGRKKLEAILALHP